MKSNFEIRYWQDIKVGDIVEIRKDEEIPADILILQTSLGSSCYTDTLNLNGENILKEKTIPILLKEIERDKLILSSGNIICNLPGENMEHWESILFIYGFKTSMICK